jgi:uncharacterized membrane protein (Fun14 family)
MIESLVLAANATPTDVITSLMPQGLPLIGGGIMGFVIGLAIKKLAKIAALVLGVIFALLMYLQYRHWINVDWLTERVRPELYPSITRRY